MTVQRPQQGADDADNQRTPSRPPDAPVHPLAGDPDIAHAYDRWSGTYDTDPNKTRELAASVLRRSQLALAKRRVVEVGCGTGLNTTWLAPQAASIVGVDFSAGMLLQARERVRDAHVSFVQHDIRQVWPLAAASADVVIAVLVLEHIELLGPVFSESARVLGAGGVLFLCELHPVRQSLGRQAEFTDRKTGSCERVAAFAHNVSDYVNAGVDAGFRLRSMGEWRHEEDAPDAPLRLLSVSFDLPGHVTDPPDRPRAPHHR